MIVLTMGSFDLLHVGHLELLRACRHMAGQDGRVVVGLNTDAFIHRYKDRAPVQPYAVREEMLRACRYVDIVLANLGEEDSKPLIEAVHPDEIAIGDDWYDEGAEDPEARYYAQLDVSPGWMKARNLAVTYVPRTRGVSTTALRGLERPKDAR